MDTENTATLDTSHEHPAPQQHQDESHAWLILIAAGVTLGIQLGRKAGLLDKMPKRWIPMFSVIGSVLGATLAGLSSGLPLVTSAANGLLVGLSATGLYEVGKPRASKQD